MKNSILKIAILSVLILITLPWRLVQAGYYGGTLDVNPARVKFTGKIVSIVGDIITIGTSDSGPFPEVEMAIDSSTAIIMLDGAEADLSDLGTLYMIRLYDGTLDLTTLSVTGATVIDAVTPRSR